MQPGMKRYVLVPILVNIVLFIALTLLLIYSFSTMTTWFTELLPEWSWLSAIAGFIAIVLSLITFILSVMIYGFSFNLITNLIAAPFYGLLAEKIEARFTGATFPAESFIQITMRTLGRELVKLWYFISRGTLVALVLLIMSFIPLINLIVPILALLWGAWVMTLQYIDYPADNNQIPFKQLRRSLKKHKYATTGFGGSIMLASMIPILNIVVMPMAVAGGTLFWMQEFWMQELTYSNN